MCVCVCVREREREEAGSILRHDYGHKMRICRLSRDAECGIKLMLPAQTALQDYMITKATDCSVHKEWKIIEYMNRLSSRLAKTQDSRLNRPEFDS